MSYIYKYQKALFIKFFSFFLFFGLVNSLSALLQNNFSANQEYQNLLTRPEFRMSIVEGVLIDPQYILVNFDKKDYKNVTIITSNGSPRREKIESNFEYPLAIKLPSYSNRYWGFGLLKLEKVLTDVQPIPREYSASIKKDITFYMLSHDITTNVPQLGTNSTSFSLSSMPFLAQYSNELSTPFESGFDPSNPNDSSAGVYDIESGSVKLLGLLAEKNLTSGSEIFAGQNVMGNTNHWINSEILKDVLKELPLPITNNPLVELLKQNLNSNNKFKNHTKFFDLLNTLKTKSPNDFNKLTQSQEYTLIAPHNETFKVFKDKLDPTGTKWDKVGIVQDLLEAGQKANVLYEILKYFIVPKTVLQPIQPAGISENTLAFKSIKFNSGASTLDMVLNEPLGYQFTEELNIPIYLLDETDTLLNLIEKDQLKKLLLSSPGTELAPRIGIINKSEKNAYWER